MKKLIISFLIFIASCLQLSAQVPFPGWGIVKPVTIAEDTLYRSGRWLMYNGSPIWAVGYDLQQLFSDAAFTENQVKTQIDTLASHGVNYIRVWANCWFMTPGTDFFPYDYADSKFDLTTWSAAFWSRYVTLITYAKTKGIFVSVCIFSDYPSVSQEITYWTEFAGNAWRSNNNSNGYYDDVSGDLYPEYFTIDYTPSGKPNITTLQEAFISKTITEFKSIGNVSFQIFNEFPAMFSGGGDYIDAVYPWQQHMATYINTFDPIVFSVHAHEGSGMQLDGLSYFSTGPADILNFHPYSENTFDNINDIGTLFNDLQSNGRVLMFPESHSIVTYPDNVTREMWAAFTNGIYYLAYQGPTNTIGDATWLLLNKRIQVLRNISDLGGWSTASRNPTLVTAGPGAYWEGIADAGDYYCYYFTGTRSTTAVSLNLPTGEYNYKWYNTLSWNGAGIASGTVSGASPASITAPATEDWVPDTGVVLVIQSTTTPETLDASYASSNYNDDAWVCDDYPRIGASFASGGGILDHINVMLAYRTTALTGDIVVKIYAHSGTFGTSSLPTGTALATSDVLDAASLSTTMTLKRFYFSGANRITLSNSTNYAFAVEYATAPDCDTKQLLVAHDNSSPTADGNEFYYPSSTWTVNSNADTIFYLYVLR